MTDPVPFKLLLKKSAALKSTVLKSTVLKSTSLKSAIFLKYCCLKAL
jgi:hypothetical protein